MSGLSANIINLITDNLRDRYQSGFPILKELMQNADDAKANRLVFGDHPGFPNSTHPLLQGKGLFFYNDGGFKESDRRAIASFAENAKAAEEGLIGKFGLGMKSVFHLCEAFFYIAKHEGQIDCDILNPWNTPDSPLHPDWDDVSEPHWEHLKEVAYSIADSDDQWFFLWLPLRTRNHLNNERFGSTGSIIDRFPGDAGAEGHDISFLRDESLKSKLAVMLPLLSYLSSIEYRSYFSTDSNFNLRLESNGRLENRKSNAVVTGSVDAESGFHLMFHGCKQVASDGSVFSSIKMHPKWPKTFSRNAQGILSQTPDKSRPEGSILINHDNNQVGHLSIQWALFLPLDDENHIFEAHISKLSQNYKFIIHGQFFVEAGRRSIHAFRHLHESAKGDIDHLDEADLRTCWNQELAQQVVLPLFLPTLNLFIQKCALKDDEISDLTEAIGRAASGDGDQGSRKFLDTYRTSICKAYSWLRLVESTGLNWRLVNHDKTPRMLLLPPPPKKEPDRPWKVLPYLSALDRETIFVDANAPRIAQSITNWAENDLLNVLDSVTPKVFSQSGLLDYLGDFIECAARPYLRLPKLQKILIALVRMGFQHANLDSLRQNRQRVMRIVDFIESGKRLALGPKDHSAGTAIPGRIFSLLWGCKIELLIVPKDLDSLQYPGDAKPCCTDVLTLLEVFHDQLQEKETPLQDRYLDIARQLLEKLDETVRCDLFRNNRDLTILSVFNARSLNEEPASFSTIEKARERQNLFGFGPGRTQQERAGLCLQLAAVIPDEQILLIRKDTFSTLFSNESLSSASDEAAILHSLGICLKSLGSEIARQGLIQRADNFGADTIGRRGLRYLLHGDKQHFTYDDVTLWVARHQQSPAWEKLWRQATGIAGQSAWNVLKRGLAQNLPQNRWALLGISEIEPARVVEELLRIGTASIDPEAFNNGECEEILSFVNDKELWKKLPLHVFQNGEKGAIRDNAYLYAGLDLPPELNGIIRIVAKRNNPQVAEKQLKWITPLDASAIISITLDAANPGRYWRFIANTLMRILPDNLEGFRQLCETPWLPLRNGKFIRPADVILIPALESHIQILAAKAEYCFSSVADLDEELQNHAIMPRLQTSCFSSGKEDGLSRLGMLMAALPDYYVGEIDIPDEDLLDKTLPVLARVQSLPAWHIVEEAKKEFDLASCIDYILRDIQHRITEGILVQTLNELSSYAEQHVKGSDEAFLIYLHIFRKDEIIAKRLLSEIRLHSKSCEWKFAGELCFGAADVCDKFLLDENQSKLLKSVIVDSGQYDGTVIDGDITTGTTDSIQSSPKVIENYFRKWEGLLQNELIGAFLCLLGNWYYDLAERYLNPHSIDWILDKFSWKSPAILDPAGHIQYIRNRPTNKVLFSLTTRIKIVNEDQVIVRSLTGNDLLVSLVKDFTTIIAGSPTWDGEYRCCLPIRDIEPGNYPAERLSFFIKETVKYVLHKCYFQLDPDLSVLWKELEKSDQLEIEVARRLILNHLPFYLRQLNAHHHSRELRNALDKYDESLQKREEFMLSPSRFTNKEKALTDDLDKQRQGLAEIFVSNESSQVAVLESLRKKLKDFQYDVQSIPFELFQNADDALLELCVTEPLDKFLIDFEPGVIRFIHWGRLINSLGPRTTDNETRGFRRDLEKMLVLSSSDKPIDERVTGKFGLGFKSVFLCCNRPCIISGNMRIEIVGGVLPQLWTGGQVSANKLASLSENYKRGGTMTELHLENTHHAENIIERFQKLSGLLCVFGKAIRHIEFHDGSSIKRISWEPKVLCNNIEIGQCEFFDAAGSFCENGIAFRLIAGTVFLALCPTGFTHLPKHIPSIWVTAPTRENESYGFAISAPFALDAGRSRLSGDTKYNIDLTQKLGEQLGEVLIEFKRLLEKDWHNSKKELKLIEDTTIAGLWSTLWRTLSAAALSNDKTSAGEICRELAMKALEKISSGQIPNGLPYPYERLLHVYVMTYELAGPWGRKNVIECLSQGGIDIARCVAADITKLLKSIRICRPLENIDFGWLISSIPECYCTEMHSENLEYLARMIWDELPEQERKSSHGRMIELKFRSITGCFVDSKDLLCAGIGDKEEELRVAFAPDNAILSNRYTEVGRSFFKRCRPRYEAPTETLMEWVLQATTDTKKQASLEYLVSGDLGHKVCRQLRLDQRLAGTWLDLIREDHALLSGWNDTDKKELLRLLVENISYDGVVLPPPPVLRPIDPSKVLNELYLWWGKNEQAKINDYERGVYPNGVFPQLSYGNLKKETEPRKGWLILFILGALHTIGRANPEQHRSFLEMCLSKGWIDRFIDPSGDSLDEWMKVLKEYLENEIQDTIYFHWMKEFVSIFLLGYWLDEYVQSFKAIDRMTLDFTLDHITCPRANPAFQGGGANAPPIKNALGMGACFVIREMSRKGIINNPLAHRYCYVPKESVRNFVHRLGCHDLKDEKDHSTRSKLIYEFLVHHLGKERAIFDGSFDLPLLEVAENPTLQQELFHKIIIEHKEIIEEEPDDNY